jgi:hypothetical protein
MNIFNFNPETKAYSGQTQANESPREPGVYLLPANATTLEPPAARDGFISVWGGSSWQVESIPLPPEPVAPPVIPVADLRRMAYMQEADPLFFEWQRGEATKEDWLAKIAEIKSKFAA